MTKNVNEQNSAWAKGAEQNYDNFLAHLGQKALSVVEKHLELCETDSARGYGKTWKRIAGMLAHLAPGAVESAGKQTLKFHIPDGKYRQQVFALEDMGDGKLRIYLPDITGIAIERGLLKEAEEHNGTHVISDGNASITLEPLSADSQEVPPFCKPMLGWGRKALRVTVNAVADETLLRTTEKLCEIAAESWTERVAAQLAQQAATGNGPTAAG